MREISKTEFMTDYERGLIYDIFYIKDKIYGKTTKGRTGLYPPYEVVWATIA